MFGEESALLGLDQPFSYITKSYATIISFNYYAFLTIMKEEARKCSLTSLKQMSAKKIEHLSHAANSRLKGEITKLQAGYTSIEHKIIGYNENLPDIKDVKPRESLV